MWLVLLCRVDSEAAMLPESEPPPLWAVKRW
jgi:hypothetical protein